MPLIRPVNFCWECGNKLWGNYKVVKIIDEQPRTLHKECANLLRELIKSKHELVGMKCRIKVPTDKEWEEYLARGHEVANAFCEKALSEPGMMTTQVEPIQTEKEP